MNRRSLFWQVFPTFVMLTAVLLLLLLLESKGQLRDFYIEQTASDLAASAALFAESAKIPLENADYDEADILAKRLGKASGLRITVVLPTGKVVAESEEDPALLDSHRMRPEIAMALDSREMASIQQHHAEKSSVRRFAADARRQTMGRRAALDPCHGCRGRSRGV
jgi:two-component system phosphate regulon sensor histidine kinase PhoR